MDETGQRPNMDRLTITSKGFQFLLEDRQTQLWQILMYYLSWKEVTVYCRRVVGETAYHRVNLNALPSFFPPSLRLAACNWDR